MRKIQLIVSKRPEGVDLLTVNLFDGKLYMWARYYGFLEVILSRYQEASRAFSDVAEQGRRSRLSDPVGTKELTTEQMETLEHEEQLATRVHLETTESFYLFAKILLDHVAGACGFYFSNRPKWTHKQLTQHFLQICAKKSLKMTPQGLRQMMTDLQKDIVEYRNRRVQHLSDPRARYGITWGAKGARMLTHLIYPSSREEALSFQKVSGDLGALLRQIDEYLGAMLDFFSANSDRSRLPGYVRL